MSKMVPRWSMLLLALRASARVRLVAQQLMHLLEPGIAVTKAPNGFAH